MDAMARQLEALQLSYQRHEATLGKQLTSDHLASWYDPITNRKRYHRSLTLGEIGCYISHRQVWQKVVAEQIPTCLILEDDLTIEPHLIDSIEFISSVSGWDMIKLSDDRANPFINSLPCDNKLSVGNYLKVPNGAQGYALSLEGAKKLLSRELFFRPVDVDFQFHSDFGLRLFGLKPYPVREDRSFESDIVNTNNGHHNNHSTAIRNIKYRISMYLQRKKISGDLQSLQSKRL